jgi:hypothetical protein
LYYVIEGSSIHIRGNDFNYLQDKNPKTGEYFTGKDDMVTWAKQFMSDISGVNNTAATVTEDTDIAAGKEFTVTVTLDVKLTLNATIEVINDTFKESFDIVFVEGVGTAKVTLKDAGLYHIMLNDFIGEDKKYFVLHGKDEFPVTVK